jgi:hypothetical protein
LKFRFLSEFYFIEMVVSLALMQGKSLLLLPSRTSGNNSSFGKAAGIWFARIPKPFAAEIP